MEGGRVTENGTFHELVSRSVPCFRARGDLMSSKLQVKQQNSRFRHLMAAQLNAAAGESLSNRRKVDEESEEEFFEVNEHTEAKAHQP